MENSDLDLPNEEKLNKKSSKTTKWHWLAIIATTLGTILVELIPHSFGTFIANFKSPLNNGSNPSFYNAAQFQLDVIPALSSAFSCISLPLFIIIIEKLKISYQIFGVICFVILATSCFLSSLVNSWTTLLLTYSLLYSIGTSTFLAITIILAAEYFPIHHRFYVLATSLCQIGYPTASLIVNPSIAILIMNYGWKYSFKIVAIIDLLFGLVISFFLKPIQNDGLCNCFNNVSKEVPTQEKEPKLIDITKECVSDYLKTHYQIWPWFFGKFINYMCWYGLRTNIVTYLMKSTEFGLINSAALMSIYGIVELVIGLTASLSGDFFREWLIHIHIVASLTLAVYTGIYTMVLSNYLSAILLMIAIGISMQLTLIFGYPASVQVWDTNSKTGWIVTNVPAGLGILSSPLFSGIVMDYYGIKYLFYIQSCGWTLQAVLYSLTLAIIKCNRIHSKLEYEKITN